MNCGLCGEEINGYGHNGEPLVKGQVCDECNGKVIIARLNGRKEPKMEPKGKDIAYWKAYTELVNQYEQKHGDEYHALAQKWAIKELAKLLRVSEKEITTSIDTVCNWLMEGVRK